MSIERMNLGQLGTLSCLYLGPVSRLSFGKAFPVRGCSWRQVVFSEYPEPLGSPDGPEPTCGLGSLANWGTHPLLHVSHRYRPMRSHWPWLCRWMRAGCPAGWTDTQGVALLKPGFSCHVVVRSPASQEREWTLTCSFLSFPQDTVV
jgi:hypothetical protein